MKLPHHALSLALALALPGVAAAEQAPTELDDVIVTATGLKMVFAGKIACSVDGQPVDFSKTFYYRNCMFSNVPNMAGAFGYLNASWTLRADLTARARIRDAAIAQFAEHGYALTAIRAFDLFPMTSHTECVALLEPADV